MSQIQVTDLTYGYEGSFDTVFENVSFGIDTDWKLGLIGRNGKGKTTFLNLLRGKYKYEGNITSSAVFDYFPYQISEKQRENCASLFLEEVKPGCEEWRVIVELGKLHADAELLYRPFKSLSHGEQTKVLLAVLFSGENDFLLIDEPTNHLDMHARECVKEYLCGKKGFILISHDRDILDACIDHVLVLNRKTIEVQSGNFSSWWENKTRMDHFAMEENEKHLKEIASLKQAAARSRKWADKNEATKIGYDPVKEHDRSGATRAYIGAKTKKMQSRVTQYERRMERKIQEKEGLLQDIEQPVSLKIMPLSYHKERLISCQELSVRYEGAEDNVLKNLTFELVQGERVFLHGENGCGKSTLIKTILQQVNMRQTGYGSQDMQQTRENMQQISGGQTNIQRSGSSHANLLVTAGEICTASNLVVSYINQDTSFLRGDIRDFCRERNLEESLFFALLRQLDMERTQFEKRLEEFSEGQKKKVLIAASLMTPAHVYIWDEPLNYIDVFSRMQIEQLILRYQPTMILVDHDIRFQEKIATRVVEL